MEGAFELPIQINYRPPAWLSLFLIFIHAGAIICIFSVPVPIWIRCVAALIMAGSLVISWQRHMRRRLLSQPQRFILTVDDKWKLLDDTGDRVVRLLPGALVHPALMVMRFRDGGRVHVLILTPETVDSNQLRRLRVRLRFKKVRG